MGFIEFDFRAEELSFNQRWAHYLSIALTVLCLLLAVNLRNQSLNTLVSYTDVEAGITAFYPQNWLLDTTGNYVFRVRNMAVLSFKTTFQVSVRPVSSETSERNILDSLSLSRAQLLTDYTILNIEDIVIGDESTGQSMRYTYVERDASPFLQSVPVVVIGIDVLTITRGQAIIITFRSAQEHLQAEEPRFEEFVRNLDF